MAGFIKKDVITSDHKRLGAIKAVFLDLDGWFIDSFVIKLDKEASTELGLKKFIGSPCIRGIKADHISVMAESVFLGITLDDVKGIMLPDEE